MTVFLNEAQPLIGHLMLSKVALQQRGMMRDSFSTSINPWANPALACLCEWASISDAKQGKLLD